MSFGTFLKSIATFGASELNGHTDLAVARPATEQYQLAAQALSGWQFGRATWPTWDPQRGATEGYARLALIYRCVNIIAHALGTATVRVYDEANDNETVPDHEMRTLMKRPNPQMGEAAFWSHVGIRASIAGFCVCEKERDGLGNVLALWPLRSAWLKAIQRRDSAHDWEYRVPGIVEPFRKGLEAENVVVFRWADTPDGSPYGMGSIEACLREVALSNVILDFVKKYVEHGAVPVYALIPDTDAPEMDQLEVDAMLDKFVARHGGLDKAVRPVYLQTIKEIVKIGSTLEEMAYTALRDVNELAICTAFGVPPGLVGTHAGLERNTFSNAKEMRASFYEDTIVPLWTRFDDALTLNLLPDFNAPPNISLEFDASKVTALQEDRTAIETRSLAALTGGAITLNRFLSETGRPAIGPAGDVYRTLFNVTWLTEDELHGTNAQAPLFAPVVREGQIVAEAEKKLAGLTPDEELALSRPRPPLALRATTRGVGYSGRLARAVNGRKLIKRIAEAREASIRSFFREQGKRIVPKVTEGLAARGSDNVLTLTPELQRKISQLFGPVFSSRPNYGSMAHATYAMEDIDWLDEDKKLKPVTEKLHVLAGKTAFDAIEQQYGIEIGIAFDVLNPNVKNVVDKLATRVTGINDTTKSLVADKVSTGLQEGKSLSEITASLMDVFDSQSRAETVARTEAMTSFGHASALGFRESGVVDRLQMFDNIDHDEDYGASDGLTCAQRDGLIVPLDDAETHIEAEHPNGSLVLTPVLIGED